MGRSCWGFRWMGSGVMMRFRRTGICIFRCWRILSPRGRWRKKYGAYRDDEGTCERALFVIDKKGMIAWSYFSPVAVNPGADGILQALEDMSKIRERPCPC